MLLKDTPEHKEVGKQKWRMCLGGHKAIEGVHYNRLDAYAPMPTWTTIKLQLALKVLIREIETAFLT